MASLHFKRKEVKPKDVPPEPEKSALDPEEELSVILNVTAHENNYWLDALRKEEAMTMYTSSVGVLLSDIFMKTRGISIKKSKPKKAPKHVLNLHYIREPDEASTPAEAVVKGSHLAFDGGVGHLPGVKMRQTDWRAALAKGDRSAATPDHDCSSHHGEEEGEGGLGEGMDGTTAAGGSFIGSDADRAGRVGEGVEASAKSQLSSRTAGISGSQVGDPLSSLPPPPPPHWRIMMATIRRRA